MRESCTLESWTVGSYVVNLDRPNLSGFINMSFHWNHLITSLDSFSKTFMRLLGPSWQLTVHCHQQHLLNMHLWWQRRFISRKYPTKLDQVLKPKISLREKCPYWKLFWSVFSHIRTKYGEILCISPYSVRMREITD